MFPGIDPKKMNAMMRQMGIKQEEISANRVIIESDEGNIIINEPSIVKINMQGQESFQITGEVSQESKETQESADNSREDIETIMEKTGCSQEQAKEALEQSNNDLAEAILSLS